MRVRLLYFAAVRERAGRDGETVEVPEGATVGDLIATMEQRLGLHDMRGKLMVAVNQEYAPPNAAVRDGDEVALIPPIAGGVGDDAGAARGPTGPEGRGGLLAVRAAPIGADEAIRAVAGPDAGGIAVFLGVVRNESGGRRVERLDYEAFRDMCDRVFARIADECAGRFGARLAILHRVGSLAVGDVAVVVAAATPHRAEAFAACRHAIDEIKRTAPIWKKEFGEGGECWVGLPGCGHEHA